MMISTMISLILLVVIKKKFNCNTFTKPLNFILAIYNGEISLKEAECSQKYLQKKKKKKNRRPKI